MCNKSVNNRHRDINHVKILAKRFSSVMGIGVGLFLDGDFYKWEQIGSRNYINTTIKIGEVWKWSN